jgi:hypothetical protein
MLDSGIIVHVEKKNSFIDGPFWYRFLDHAQEQNDIKVNEFMIIYLGLTIMALSTSVS